jgi:two-component system, OmpR family, sensor histidine kinase MprB
MSIRTRLMITTSAIVLVVVGVLSIGIYSTFSRQLVRQVDKSLDDRVVMIADSLRRESQRPNIGRQRNPLNEALLPTRFDTVTQVVDTTGTVVLALGEVELPVTDKTLQIANDPSGNVFRSTVTINGDKYRMLTVPLTGGGALQLAKDINDLQRAQNAVRGWQFALGPIGIMFAGLAGWWVARRTARPIQQLADAAEDIARTQNLSTKLDIHGDYEIEQLANSFNAMLAALQYSSEQQKQLVQDASHELRTPLTSLRANAELLQRDSLDEATKQAVLRDIAAEIDELTELSSELTALASDQRLVEEPQIVNLLEACDDIAARASRRTGRMVSVTSTNPSSALVRPSQFDRAVGNLVDNALKFCPTPVNVEINIVGSRVEVIDHGQGIADADKPLVFDRFYRATATRALPGSGLGLAIVKQFADDHNAVVAITDTPGGGATVALSFENRVS